MRMRFLNIMPKWALIVGLVWMSSHTDAVMAQRSSSGTFGSSASGLRSSRSGSNRQSSLGLQSGGLQAGSQTPLASSSSTLGQPVEPGLSNALPQGRDFREGAFVGRDAQDVRDTFRNLSRGQGRRAMMDMVIENLNEMRESRKRWRDQQRQPPAVRIQLRPAFDYLGISVDQLTAGVQLRLTTMLRARVMQEPGVAPPRVELKGRTATLRGSVRSEHEKLLAGQLVAIEPGISRVDNRLVVVD